MARGKRYTAASEGVDRDKTYPLAEAVKMVKANAKAKFDETIEIAMNLGIDPRHADQAVRGMVDLPSGTGKTAGVKAAKAGSIEFRAEKAGIIHAGVGKASFSEDAIAANVKALVTAISRAKPAGAKGTFIKKVSISSTMGPGVKLDPATALNT